MTEYDLEQLELALEFDDFIEEQTEGFLETKGYLADWDLVAPSSEEVD